MSGTSLDGLDVALCHFNIDESWEFQIEFSKTFSYDEYLRTKLSKSHNFHIAELMNLEEELTNFHAKCINHFINANSISRTHIDAIASHGHTILHQPENGFTLQIIKGSSLSQKTGINTISDFRSSDIALGGQGAPLVPIGDEFLFKDFNSCLNLGGIANGSYKKNGKRVAFDICFANMLNNKICNNMGYEFDRGGALAKSGRMIPDLLAELDNMAFLHNSGPKSIGIETFESICLPILNKYDNNIDALHTVGWHITSQIAKNLKGSILVTGGGTHNDFWMELLGKHDHLEIIKPNATIIDFKEALVFAFLGARYLRDEHNCLASVTGASRNSIGGCLYKA